MTLIVHPLDPKRVADAVSRRVALIESQRQGAGARYEETRAAYARTLAEGKSWRGAPPKVTDPLDLAAYYDQAVTREQTYYAQVRVVEDQAEAHADKPFFLVYGDAPNQGPHRTGGFASFAAAEACFMRLGR